MTDGTGFARVSAVTCPAARLHPHPIRAAQPRRRTHAPARLLWDGMATVAALLKNDIALMGKRVRQPKVQPD